MGGPILPTDIDSLATLQAWALALGESAVRAAVSEQLDVAGRTSDAIGWERINGKELHGGFRFCPGGHVVLIDYAQNEDPPAIPTDSVTLSSSTDVCGAGTALSTIEEFDFLEHVLADEPSAITSRLSDVIEEVVLAHSGTTYEAEFSFKTGSPSKLTASATLSGGSFGAISVT